MVKQFTMSFEKCTTGFSEYIRLNLSRPAGEQLKRRRLVFRNSRDDGSHIAIKKIIEHNASLKIDFGWSFESGLYFQKIMDEAVEEISPRYNVAVGTMTTDMSCNWLGFIPHNAYDREVYKDFSTSGLIIYNNEIIDFQIEIVEFLTGHELFKRHAILRDDLYRFALFKECRRDRVQLEEAYRYYMDSILSVCGVPHMPRDMLEEEIGCHFLYEPDLFFELVAFSKLKGEVVE